MNLLFRSRRGSAFSSRHAVSTMWSSTTPIVFHLFFSKPFGKSGFSLVPWLCLSLLFVFGSLPWLLALLHVLHPSCLFGFSFCALSFSSHFHCVMGRLSLQHSCSPCFSISSVSENSAVHFVTVPVFMVHYCMPLFAQHGAPQLLIGTARTTV